MSSTYHLVLFVHVTAAILLVGGSAWTHVAVSLAGRASTVDGVRSQLAFVRTFVRASMPIAMLVLLAGAWLATDAGMWRDAWLLTSLVLFLAVGAVAGRVVDPSVADLVAAADEAPDGPVGPSLAAALHAPRIAVATTLMSAADVALVFLMTNKPGLAGSLTVVTVCLALGGAVAARSVRARGPAAGAAPA